MARRRPTPIPPRRRGRWLIAAGAAAVVALVAGLVVVLTSGGTSGEVATVGGRSVSADELLFHLERVRSNQPAGEDSDEQLRQAALQDIADDEALLHWAEEYGLTPFADFAGFLQFVDRTNQDRAAALARGEIVYGLTSYTPQQLYAKTMTDLRAQLIQRLTGGSPVIAVTDAEVATFYSANRSDWEAGVADYAATRWQIPGWALDGRSPDALSRLIADDGGLTADAKDDPGSRLESVNISAASAGGPGSSISPQTLQQLQTLQVGQHTDPQSLDGGVVVFQLDKVVVDDAAALKEYGTRIRAVLVEKKFDALLAARIAAQHTEIRHPAWDAVNLKGRQS